MKLDLHNRPKSAIPIKEENPVWESIKFEVQWNFNNYIKSPIKMIFRGLKNFWRFRKVIWNFNWWDYDFTQKVHEQCLIEMNKGWDEAHYIGSEDDQKQIQDLIDIMKTITESCDECTVESEANTEKLFAEFGEKLYSIREFERYTSETSTQKIKTNLVTVLWD